MTEAHSLDLDPIIARVLSKLIREGAEAVVLAGSYVRGTWQPGSDLDFIAIGARESYLCVEVGVLVSVAWQSQESTRAAFADVSHAGSVIPGWRRARILHDPSGIAAALRGRAEAWSWDEAAADAWVANEITGWAEEVHKLVSALRSGRMTMAAVQRSVLALRMATVLAVHQRLFYEGENELWDLVAANEGPEWTTVQWAAFSGNGECPAESSRAALSLYAYVARRTRHLLDARQMGVVANACLLAGFAPSGARRLRSRGLKRHRLEAARHAIGNRRQFR